MGPIRWIKTDKSGLDFVKIGRKGHETNNTIREKGRIRKIQNGRITGRDKTIQDGIIICGTG